MKKDFVVIFDLDGTLLNTDLVIRKSFDHVFHQYKEGYILSEEEHLSFLGPTLVSSFQRYFPEDMIDELVECYRDYNMSHHKDYVTIYPTVKDTLKTLKNKGYPLAVVTTKKKDAALLGLDLFELTDCFDVIIGVDNVEKVKPDPEGILTVMKQTNCMKGVMIGDNVSDILAGKNAHIYTIGVNWSPKGSNEIKKLKPDMMIDKMQEIIGFIESKGE